MKAEDKMGSEGPKIKQRSRKNKNKVQTLNFPNNLDCNVVLVGLMGAGKSCIGRRLAQRLSLPFVDADAEIEAAAGCSVEEIFAEHGEAYFRDGERRVIERLLSEKPQVVATGGGAYLDELTREAIRKKGVAVWLRADLPLLLKRTSRRDNRPLLKRGNPKEILQRLIEERYPVYDKADVAVDSVDGPPEVTLERTFEALETFFKNEPQRLTTRMPDK
jgi:shikimate kinase